MIELVLIKDILKHGSMILSARHRMKSSPAMLTVVFKTGHTTTKERCWLIVTLNTITFITELILQYIRFQFNLTNDREEGVKMK